MVAMEMFWHPLISKLTTDRNDYTWKMRKRGREEHQKTQTPLAEQRRDLLPPVVFFAPIHMAITMIQSRFNHDHIRSGSPMVLPAGPSVEASSPMPSSTTPRAAFENPW
ncbi:hypothetical protein RYX36_036940 [Vicia faba]